MTDDRTTIETAFEALAAAAKDNPRGLLTLATQAHKRGADDRAYQLAREAQALAPDDAEIAAIASDLIARCIPNWHIRMVQDTPRNDAFQAALERAVTPESRVLDIGAGTGLLAMMAVRAGAGEVHSCELNPAMATLANEIVAANDFADDITIHNKNSSKIDPEADLGGKVDIVVAEILGNDVVCEHVLPTMRDAVRRLAKPGAQMIPCAADIRVALAWWPPVELRRVGEVSGFDLSLLNRLRRSHYALMPSDPELELRGEEAILFAFDFTSTEEVQEQAAVELVSHGGRVNGVAQWFRMQMDEQAFYETRPDRDFHSSWACVYYPFDQIIDTVPGDTVTIGGTIRGHRLRVWKAS